jgi:hypothetical protein
MANKPASRNWNDIQVVIATGAMVLTLALWNLFAEPDRAAAVKRAQEQAAQPPQQPAQIAAPVSGPQPILQGKTLLGNGPILLGGSAPQTQVIIRTGGGSGGGATTSTSSS